MLSDAQNVGEDWGDLEWRRKVEEEKFTDWKKKMQLQDGGLFAALEPESKNILACRGNTSKDCAMFSQDRRMQSSQLSVKSQNSDSRGDGKQERKKSRFRDSVKFWSKSKTPNLLSLTPTSTSQSMSSINLPSYEEVFTGDFRFPSETLLKNLLGLHEKDEAEVSRAVVQFKEIASTFQEATSTVDKAR
ncbi:hypothetical protein RUND412_001505 [Rhizina undulata]